MGAVSLETQGGGVKDRKDEYVTGGQAAGTPLFFFFFN